MELTIGVLKKIIQDLPDDIILATLQIGNNKFHSFSNLKRLILLENMQDGQRYLTINQMGSHFTQTGEQKNLFWNCREWNDVNIDKSENVQIKSALQQDYEAVINFDGDWVKPLMDKYNLTREEVLSKIRL